MIENSDESIPTSALYAPVLYKSGEFPVEKTQDEINLSKQYETIQRILKIVQVKKEDSTITIYELMTDYALKRFVIDSGIITNERVLAVLGEDAYNTNARDMAIHKQKKEMSDEINTCSEVSVNSLQAYQIFKVLSETFNAEEKAFYAKMTAENIIGADEHTQEVFKKKHAEEIWENFERLSFNAGADLAENIKLQKEAYSFWQNDLCEELSKEQKTKMKEKVAAIALQVMDQIVETTNIETDDLETLSAQSFKAYELWYQHTPKRSSGYEDITTKAVQFGRAIVERIYEEEITEEQKLKAEHGILSYLPDEMQQEYNDLLVTHAKRADQVFDDAVKEVEGKGLQAQIEAGQTKAEWNVAMLARGKTKFPEKQLQLLKKLCDQRIQRASNDDERVDLLTELKNEMVSNTEKDYIDERIERLELATKEAMPLEGIFKDLQL